MSGLFGGGSLPNSVQSTLAAGIRVQTSIAGRAIALVYGVNRVSGNVIWYGNFQAVAQSNSSGGKGGSSSSKSYTYSAAFAIALCEGQITGVGTVWASNGQYTMSDLGFTLMTGPNPQSPWSFLSSNYPAQAVPYVSTAYVCHPSYNLGSSPSLPNLSFEVFGLFKSGMSDYTGVSPDVVLGDMLSNGSYGVDSRWASWLGTWTQYANYCKAQGLLISPVIDDQEQAQQTVQDILDATNANCFFSEGVLKIVSYGDTVVSGNGYTYTPNVTPIYALNDDNFIFKQGEDPIQITRSSPQDAYNDVTVEVVDQPNNYATYIAEAKDMFAIQTYGPRPDTVKQYHFLTQQWQGQLVAQTLLQRELYIRNQYQFKLGWVFCGLEPMDLVTLTDSRMGLSNVAVRIIQIEEDADGVLTFTAEEFPPGVATPALYSSQVGAGANINYNAPAPNPSEIMFAEPPGELTDNELMLWVGVAGQGNWGGCNIWTSVDGQTYVRQATIHGSARIGNITSALPVGSDPDTTHTLGVSLSNSLGALSSGTKNDADTYNTLCVVGQELISYETATLTSAYNYNLTYLRRGAYGTPNVAHKVNEQFMRFDQSIFQYQFAASRIGTPVYFKFQAFNQYEGGEQELSSCLEYTYTLQGTALSDALPNVTGLYDNYVAGITQLFWTPVSDYRGPDYEVRFGPAWATAKLLGRTTAPGFGTQGDGTYWVSAHYIAPSGVNVYSSAPVSITIAGSILVQNVVASYDEAATGWPGTVSGGANINRSQNALILDGVNNFLALTSVLTDTDILWSGGVALSGSYALPTGQAVNAGRVVTCSVRMSYNAYGESIYANFLALANVLVVSDLFNAALGQSITVTPQIAVAQANGVYGAWQNYQPGSYTGQYFKAQLLLATSGTQVTPLVTDLTFAVDVPDRVDSYTNVSVLAAGTTITFAVNGVTTPFNGGPGSATVPNVQVSVLNGNSGDTVLITGKTLNSVTIQVVNGGVGVARTVDVIAQGY